MDQLENGTDYLEFFQAAYRYTGSKYASINPGSPAFNSVIIAIKQFPGNLVFSDQYTKKNFDAS